MAILVCSSNYIDCSSIDSLIASTFGFYVQSITVLGRSQPDQCSVLNWKIRDNLKFFTHAVVIRPSFNINGCHKVIFEPLIAIVIIIFYFRHILRPNRPIRPSLSSPMNIKQLAQRKVLRAIVIDLKVYTFLLLFLIQIP